MGVAYPFVCRVSYWNDCSNKIDHENALIYAGSFTEATTAIENMYGDNIDSLELYCLGDIGLFTVNDEIAKMLIEGEGSIQ